MFKYLLYVVETYLGKSLVERSLSSLEGSGSGARILVAITTVLSSPSTNTSSPPLPLQWLNKKSVKALEPVDIEGMRSNHRKFTFFTAPSLCERSFKDRIFSVEKHSVFPSNLEPQKSLLTPIAERNITTVKQMHRPKFSLVHQRFVAMHKSAYL